jgi:hypothetical protein
MGKMKPKPEAELAGVPRQNFSEWSLAVILTVAVVALHFYFLNHVGGLWRDEVTSVNIAQGSWSQITNDSFPILFPLLLRTWSGLGLGAADLGLRWFGGLAGLFIIAAFWLAAWWMRRSPPLWSLVLAGLNAWVIYYSTSLRAYGLGSAMIAFCAAAAWFFVENPGRKTWCIFAVSAVLSVQTLYQNTALVAAICAGACVVSWRQKNIRLAIGGGLGGLTAAVSLLPYWQNISGMPQAASPLRLDFDRVIAWDDLDTLLAFPLPQFVWVWFGLAGWVLVRAVINGFSARPDDRSLFAITTIVFSSVLFVVFLRLAKFPVQPWYFLPLLMVVAVCLECSLPRTGGRFRPFFGGGMIATALVSIPFAARLLDGRFTNGDLLAKKIAGSAGEKDFVVVTSWQGGITFGRYFKKTCEWTTLPPIGDHSCHRYDLLKLQMQNTNALQPVLDGVANTLRSGGTVWVVGGINDVNTPAEPPPLPLPPLPSTGWHESPYLINWNNQFGWFLRHHSSAIECLDLGTNGNIDEVFALSKVTGWKGGP